MSKILNKAIEAVKAAGKIMNSYDLDNSEIYEKGTANYVTKIDYNVENFLVKELRVILPDSNIITEEAEKNIYNFQNPTWILDPVDGTTNLIHGYNQSAVSLGLFIEKKPFIGIIYNPWSNELFTAEAGKGAFLNGSRIKVSKNSTLESSLICFGTSPYDKNRSDKVFSITKNIFNACKDIRRSGSAALDLAYTACGRIDAYYEMDLKPWDYAAGFLIVEEAGGKVTDWKGMEPNFERPSDIIASNGLIHDLLISSCS